MQTVNLSANEVLEHLKLWVPTNWTAEAGELDVVCVNSPKVELGWIVTLNICPCKGYNFTVHEFVLDVESGKDTECDDEFLTYDEALNHIRNRFTQFIEV